MIETNTEILMPFSINSNLNDIMKLINLFKSIEQSGIKRIYLNYKQTTFFSSELYGLYHYFIELLKEMNIEIIGINVNEKVDYVMHLSGNLNINDPSYISGIQHKAFDTELESGNINCFDEYLTNEFLPKMIGNEVVSSIVTSYLSELFINARTHGQTHKIRCNGQKYNDGKTLKFVIVDFGVTIPYKVSNHLINNKLNYFHTNDGEAIRWAATEGNTTKEKLGGLGLNAISEFIKKYNGKIMIISRNGYFEVNPYRNKITTLEHGFKGTFVLVELDLEKLSKISIPQKGKEKFQI